MSTLCLCGICVQGEILRMQITIPPASLCCEFQNTIVRVADTFLIIGRVSFLPEGFLQFHILRYLHQAHKHDSLITKTPSVVEIKACLRVFHILLGTHGGSIAGKVETVSLDFLWCKYCLDIRESVLIYGSDKRCLLFQGEFFNIFFGDHSVAS